MLHDPFSSKHLPSISVSESTLKHKSKGIIYTAGNKKLRSNFEVAELDGLTDEGS
jgi:hypothetical protein